MDPYAALRLKPGAGPGEVARAYRELAKEYHPDRAPGDAVAEQRMREINAAYAALRGGDAARALAATRAASATPRGRSGPGGWLHPKLRRALGVELLAALERDEPVLVVTDAAMWDSPTVRLVLTDRRLLWLRDDALTDRVRWLRYQAVEAVEGRLRRPLRRVGELLVQPRGGKRLSFAELEPGAVRLLVLTLRRHV